MAIQQLDKANDQSKHQYDLQIVARMHQHFHDDPTVRHAELAAAGRSQPAEGDVGACSSMMGQHSARAAATELRYEAHVRLQTDSQALANQQALHGD